MNDTTIYLLNDVVACLNFLSHYVVLFLIKKNISVHVCEEEWKTKDILIYSERISIKRFVWI